MTLHRYFLSLSIASLLLHTPGELRAAEQQPPPDSNVIVRTAVDIVCGFHGGPPLNYFLVPLQRSAWPPLLTDGDLRPFLTASDQDTDSVVIVIPEAPTAGATTYAVYFRGTKVTSVSVVPGHASHVTREEVLSSRRPVPADPKTCACDLSYQPGELRTDDDVPVNVYKVLPVKSKEHLAA